MSSHHSTARPIGSPIPTATAEWLDRLPEQVREPFTFGQDSRPAADWKEGK